MTAVQIVVPPFRSALFREQVQQQIRIRTAVKDFPHGRKRISAVFVLPAQDGSVLECKNRIGGMHYNVLRISKFVAETIRRNILNQN